MAAALPWIRSRWFDKNGKPLAGGKVWFYQAGTTVPKTSYTDSTGLTPNTNPVILDANGEADIWLIPGSYKMVLMDKNDVVQYTRDHIKPNDGGGGGITDGDYIFDGYSARFNEQFGPTLGLQDTLAKILNITYTPPTVSLSASGNVLREKGTAVTSMTLSAAITKKSDPIATVRFYEGATLKDTQTSGGGIPAGATSTYNWTGSFSDNKTFSVQVDDNGATGGPTTVSSSTTFNFVYPYYSGKGAPGLTNAQIQALTKQITQSSATVSTGNLSASNGETFYFAQPASYTAITQILDINGYDVTADFTVSTGNITMLDGASVSYRFYRFNNTVSAGTYKYDFKR